MPGTSKTNVISSLSASHEEEIAVLAKRADSASGMLMKLVAFVGSNAENILESLPDVAKDSLEDATVWALDLAYRGASMTSESRMAPDVGKHGHKLASVFTGAVGGFAGVSSAIVELPVTVSIMFAAIQKAARAEGFDPKDEEVRRECLLVFGSGNPATTQDDGINTSFLASRVLINGVTVHGLIASVAPRLAAVLTQKLAAQTIPVLGSVTGAGVNYAFTDYYQELAEIRFALRRLAHEHGEEVVRLSFNSAMAERKRLKSR
ncbi:EcsC family protein [Defluviimonas denitrificans]|jgi:hypothetical protein|uniref:EcsC family protein n=1 Tax=Albidovulum denitrificans TaxID=404881 RepID=A0A2S8SER0_9RHOB|nr:EcsC family protein [Defluviimonas denitrificans]PQV59280.1 EcsC family protein [Defluviimonas denitrificans]